MSYEYYSSLFRCYTRKHIFPWFHCSLKSKSLIVVLLKTVKFYFSSGQENREGIKKEKASPRRKPEVGVTVQEQWEILKEFVLYSPPRTQNILHSNNNVSRSFKSSRRIILQSWIYQLFNIFQAFFKNYVPHHKTMFHSHNKYFFGETLYKFPIIQGGTKLSKEGDCEGRKNKRANN